MRVVEDAFIYRLVWAIEAVRMKRRAEGGVSEFLEGTAAACLETGLPQGMMAMLVRAGLPSRITAKAVIEETQPVFVSLSEMNTWLGSNEVTVLSDQADWPTPETAAIWRQFRSDALSGPVQKWTEETWKLQTDAPAWVNLAHPARVQIDDLTGEVSGASVDYRRIVGIKQGLEQGDPSLIRVDFAADGKSAQIGRTGRSKARWQARH